MAELYEGHPMIEKLASFGRDKSTGKFHRLPVEGELLAATPELKSEFDRIDELSEEEMLQEYGYNAIDPVTYSMMRLNPNGMPEDRFRTAGDDFEYERAEFIDGTITWVPIMHCVKVTPSGVRGIPDRMEPDFVWPRQAIRMVYGHALKAQAAR